MTALPGILAEFATLAGQGAALALARDAGGTRIYVPVRAHDGHWLVMTLGRAAADALCTRFGGGSIEVPLADTGSYKALQRTVARRIHELDEAKASERTIARRVGVTDRTVRRHRRAHGGRSKGNKQGSLL